MNVTQGRGPTEHNDATSNHSARVEHFASFEYQGVITEKRAIIPCGCSIFISESDGMPNTLGRPCCEPHQRIIRLATELLVARDPFPDELFTAVVAEALGEASHEIRPETVEDA